jgi:hypothetical protein
MRSDAPSADRLFEIAEARHPRGRGRARRRRRGQERGSHAANKLGAELGHVDDELNV